MRFAALHIAAVTSHLPGIYFLRSRALSRARFSRARERYDGGRENERKGKWIARER